MQASGQHLDLANVILAASTFLGVIFTFILGVLNRRTVMQTKDKVEEVHKAANGVTDRYGEAKLAQGRSEGKAEGLALAHSERRASDTENNG